MITPEIKFCDGTLQPSNAGAKNNNGLNLVWYLQTAGGKSGWISA